MLKNPAPDPGDRRILWIAVLGAAVLRMVAWQRTAVLFNDGPVFLYIAEAAQGGDWSAVVRHPFHPLYSLVIAVIAPLAGGLETAAVVTSIAAGCAAVIALESLLRPAFGGRIAAVGALLLAMHPSAVDFSSDVQSEGLYIALFLAALASAWHALERGRPALAAAAGLFSGFAYLTRPEGLGVALLCGLMGATVALRGRWPPSRSAAWLTALILGAALPALPYTIGLRVETGHWTLTQKKSPVDFTGLGTRAPGPLRVRLQATELDRKLAGELSLPRASDLPVPTDVGIGRRAIGSVAVVLGAAGSSLRWELLPFVVLGLWLRRGRPGSWATLQAAVIGLYGAVLLALAFGAGYASRRHTLPPLLPLLGYAALGVESLGRTVWGAVGSRGRLAKMSPAGGALSVALLVAALLMFPRDLRERRPERRAERRAAEWLRARSDLSGVVAAGKLRIAYYAGEPFVPLPSFGSESMPGESMLGFLRRRGARYVVVDDALLEEHRGLSEALAIGLRLIHREQVDGRSAGVYEVASRSATRGSR